MDDLPLPEEADHVGDVGVILGQAENVVVSHPGLLLGGHILGEVTDGIALYPNGGSRPGESRGCRGINPRSVVHKVGGKPRVILDLVVGEVPGQLVDNGGNHL